MNEDKAKLYDSAEGRAFVEQVRQREAVETMYEALGVRALACKHWRWMEGMLGLSLKSSSRSIWIRVVDRPNDDTSECWPDLRDPATLGCLLELAREAWQRPRLCCYSLPIRDMWYIDVDGRSFSANTEAEAIVAALEGAPTS